MDPQSPDGTKRASVDPDDSSRKKAKMSTDPGQKYNPYLAHLSDDSNNGYGALAGMKRHQTTAQQAARADDSDSSPFTGKPHSQRYFDILQTRRNLPVYKQR